MALRPIGRAERMWCAVALGVALATVLGPAIPVPAVGAASAAPATPTPPQPRTVTLDPEVGASSWYQVVTGADGRSSLYVGRLAAPTYRVIDAPSPVRVVAVSGRDWPRNVVAWWREDGRTVIEVAWDEGSVYPVARIRPSISALTTSPDGRWVAFSTVRPDGTDGGVWRRRISRYGSQDVERLASAQGMVVSRLLYDVERKALLLAGTTREGAVVVRAVSLETGQAGDISVDAGASVVGILGDELVLGRRAADGSSGPPFQLRDLTTGAIRTVGEGEGSRAMVVAHNALVWESSGPGGFQSIEMLAVGDPAPRTAWTGTEPSATASVHLVDASDSAGVGLAGRVALFPGSLPFHLAPDAGSATSGLVVNLADATMATVPPIAPPILEGPPWRPTLIARDDRFMSVDDVSPYQGGFLAVGKIGDARRWMTWSSPDGRRWTMRPFPLAPDTGGSGRLFAHGRRVILVVSDVSSRHGPSRIRIWTSDDGVAWDPVPVGPQFGIGSTRDPETASGLVSVRDIGRLHGRWVISGAFCIEGCSRWYLWTSRDARHWTRHALPQHLGPDRASGISDVVIGRGRLLGTRWVSVNHSIAERQAVASPDGRHWSILGHWPDSDFSAVVDGPDGLIVVGRRDDDHPSLVVWRSVDGRSWEQVYADPLQWGIDAVAASGTRIVIAGRAMVNAEGEDYATAALVSDDGRSWQRSLGWFMPMSVYLQTAAIAGDHVVILGQTQAGGGSPLGWHATLGNR